MHRFKYGKGNNEYSLDVENIKFLIGDNKRLKFTLYNIAHSVFNKISNSESAVEQMGKHSLSFDERYVNLKEWLYFEVTPFFDLEADCKMGTKSLLSKYLDSKSDLLDQSEIFNTLSILVNSINEDFFDNETKINFGNKELKLQLGEITRPIICKEVYPVITNEDYACNSADLEYEELILLQLALIEKICATNISKNIYVYCYIPYLTGKIRESLYGIKYERCFLIVDTDEIPKTDINSFCICSKHYLDFANHEMVLDKLSDFPFHIEKDELILLCETAINDGIFDKNKTPIVELFPWKT